MTSTAIFAEILVVGLQAALWLGMLLLLLGGKDGEDFVRTAVQLKEWAVLITVFVIGSAYTLGILVDRLADSVVSYFEEIFFPDDIVRNKALEKLRKDGLSVTLPSSVGLMRMHVMGKSPEMTKFLEYIRSRMRIARSTSFNLVPMIVVAVLLVRRQNYLWILVTYHVGLVLLGLSLYVSFRISESYFTRLCEAYGLIQRDKLTERDKTIYARKAK